MTVGFTFCEHLPGQSLRSFFEVTFATGDGLAHVQQEQQPGQKLQTKNTAAGTLVEGVPAAGELSRSSKEDAVHSHMLLLH